MVSALPADTLQPVELADGVEIHLRVAGPAARSVAWLLDLILFIALILVLLLLVSVIGPGLGEQTAQGLFLLGLFFLSWFYNVFFEMGKRAATPGQRFMGLKVASVSGAPVRWPQSIIRNLLRVIDFMPGCYLFGLMCCLFTRRFQRLGDLVADTVVIYADARPSKAKPSLSPEAAAYLTEPVAPPTALSRAEQAALLQFLERAPHWSEARRIELADVIEPLTGRSGPAGLRRAQGMALWLQNGGQSTPSAPRS